MLQEAIDVQQNAVAELLQKIKEKQETTFRAPTGSGKTRMMADFMNRVLSEHDEVVFIVSTLSKGNLAEQNYNVFKKCADKKIFPSLNPHLISSEVSGEERLFIPAGFNVYVLPRDLYKDGSRLKDQGAFVNFLSEILAMKGGGKHIYLIKDECHQATNNLDSLGLSMFEKIINFSATPKLSRGQVPDVEITDDVAENAKLIKKIEWGDEDDDVEDAIKKFEEIKENYRNLIGVNPCLIIQISNKDKAEDEWNSIKTILNKSEHQALKWMSIVENKGKCDTNDKVKKLGIEKWKNYAKENSSTIDIIIFKMVISEGWDIPRACMLYQVRDTKSKQLDEQVMGRVRRNPRLGDFEKLSSEAQELALTAWVWGIKPKDEKTRQLKLAGTGKEIAQNISIYTTRLQELTERKDFDVDTFIAEKSKHDITTTDIFSLYNKLRDSEQDLRNFCYDYAKGDVEKWFRYCQHLDEVKKEYNNFVCRYEESMTVKTDDDGNPIGVTFPLITSCVADIFNDEIENWVWENEDKTENFCFDSDAERRWARILERIAEDSTDSTEVCEEEYRKIKNPDGTVDYGKSVKNTFLWGKNFLQNSEIKFEYYLNGIHSSYPDFVMKDKKGNIHLFEVKCLNESSSQSVNPEEYKRKIEELKKCYTQSSLLLKSHIFYIPILEENVWKIFCYKNGTERVMDKETFMSEMKKKDSQTIS